jgi:hypothetical protein
MQPSTHQFSTREPGELTTELAPGGLTQNEPFTIGDLAQATNGNHHPSNKGGLTGILVYQFGTGEPEL